MDPQVDATVLDGTTIRCSKPRSALRAVVLLMAVGLASACSGGNGRANSATSNNATTATTGMTGSSNSAVPGCGDDTTRVVTADWLNRSLTVLSYDCLTDPNCTIDDAILSTIDLQPYAPGPMELEHIPGTCQVLVAVGPGFFNPGAGAILIGSPDVPDGGGLLRVDLDTGAVIAEIATADIPMGLAVTPDGATAFTANHGGTTLGDTMSVIDLATNAETDAVSVGAGPEQVALSEDGAWGIVNAAVDDGVRFFSTADPASTLSAAFATGDDSSDVDLLGDRAVVVNSIALNLSVFDFTTPTSPSKLEDVPIGGGAPYGVTRIPGTSRVLVTTSLMTSALVELDLSTTPATVVSTIELPGRRYPIGVAVSPDGAHAFVAHAQDHVLSVVDLDTGDARGLTWLDQPGPTYVIVVP